jgi:hypothetical protein
MPRAHATHEDGPLKILFSGDLEDYPEGAEVTNIQVEKVWLFNHQLDHDTLPEALQGELYLCMEKVEFNLEEVGDDDANWEDGE